MSFSGIGCCGPGAENASRLAPKDAFRLTAIRTVPRGVAEPLPSLQKELDSKLTQHRAELHELLDRWLGSASEDDLATGDDVQVRPAFAECAVLYSHSITNGLKKPSSLSEIPAVEDVVEKKEVTVETIGVDDIFLKPECMDDALLKPKSQDVEEKKLVETKPKMRFSQLFEKEETFRKRASLLSNKTDGLNYQDNWCAKIVISRHFDHFCAFMIIVNSVVVGLQVEFQDVAESISLVVFKYFSLAFFTFELILRLWARGTRKFCTGPDKGWNFFDAFCVGASYLEIIATSMFETEGAFLLVVRTMRIIRIVRIIRVVKFLSQLRMMCYTMLGALRLLGWMLVLLFMIIYMFAICFTEAVTLYMVEVPVDIQQLDRFFGSVENSMLTLFKAITGGLNWGEPLDQLKRVHFIYAFMYLWYVCVSILTMLNVITGFCCEHAIESASADREQAIQEQLRDQDMCKKAFASVFKALDQDGSGGISAVEFQEHFEDEEVQAWLSHLNISVHSAIDMFELLDKDCSGTVSVEEFVTGCMRMRGNAKTLDVLRMQEDVTKIFQRIDEFERKRAQG